MASMVMMHLVQINVRNNLQNVKDFELKSKELSGKTQNLKNADLEKPLKKDAT